MRTPRVNGPVLIRALSRHGWTHVRTSGDHFILICPAGKHRVSVLYHNHTLSMNVMTSIRRTGAIDTGTLITMLKE